MHFIELFRIVPNEGTAVAFLQNYGIIPKSHTCVNGHGMILSPNRIHWLCHKCKEKLCIRTDTWLECSDLPIHKVVYFIYWWSEGLTSVKFMTEQLKIGEISVMEFNDSLREVCLWKIENECEDSSNTFCNVSIRDNHTCEALWRQGVGDRDAFEEILNDISSFHFLADE